MTNDEVVSILDRLMMPNETLSPKIFDCQKIMLSNVREGLLKIANLFIEKVFSPIKGLEVIDICLTGSLTGYFYHENSDIDIGLEIHNRSCPFVSKDFVELDKFLNMLANTTQRTSKAQMFNDMFVDIKTFPHIVDGMSLYSILHNNWRISPNHDMCVNVSKAEILDKYYQKKAQIEADVENIKQDLKGIASGDLVNEYYKKQFITYSKVEDYLVFKLLSKTKIISSLGKEVILTYNKICSLS